MCQVPDRPLEPDFKEHLRSRLAGRSRQTVVAPALRCAAVLIPLLQKSTIRGNVPYTPIAASGDPCAETRLRSEPPEWHVLVTQRTPTVEHHKGQISFPGGMCDPKDADQLATALRETFEEIGVPPQAVDILGILDDQPTISEFNITPFVGVIPYPFDYRLSEQEVEALVEVPLSFLMDPANLRVERREHAGRTHDVLFWDYGPYTIWGATARILKGLLDLAFAPPKSPASGP